MHLYEIHSFAEIAAKQIDAVFLTVEPNSGPTNQPAEEPVWFAELHADPSHP